MPQNATPSARSTLALLALAAGLWTASPIQAATRPLSDREMSDVRGADGTITADLQTTVPGAIGSLQAALSTALAGSSSTLLNTAEFATALAPFGLTPSAMPGYTGQAVAATQVESAPVSFSFDMSSVLQTLGVDYKSSNGASMGTFAIKDFDARGTTIWVWQHH